jgi:hypothetical protein
MDTTRRLGVVVCMLVLGGGHAGAAAAEPGMTKEMFGRLRLVDEVIPGKEEARHRFTESARGISEVRAILGQPTRVMPAVGDAPRLVVYRLGQGKNLQARRAYVLQVDYPEDVSRTMFMHVRGAETSRGLSTGQSDGDVLVGKYTDSNIESLRYPLSGKHESFQMGNDWVNQSHSPKRQENVLRMLAADRYDFTVLPYYEYVGSVGAKSPGTRRLARPLSDIPTYTHIARWNDERKEFLEALRDHVRGGGAKDAVIFFTAESSEPGPTLAGGGKKVVTDDRPTWERLL